MPKALSVAIVGVTGAVGREFLTLFERRDFPVADPKLLASERSAGTIINFRGKPITVEIATPDKFENVDIAFFSAGAPRSRDLVPAALNAGAICIDNSSAFRMDPAVPLVVPEINWHDVKPEHRLFPVANCTAIVLCMAVAPLLKLGNVERLIVSTYQSASGGGAAMMADLEDQTRAYLSLLDQVTHCSRRNPSESSPCLHGEGREEVPVPAPAHRKSSGLTEPYAFNLFSHNTPINDVGYNEEEWKVIQETQKILGMPNLKVNVTCVRVPILRAHSESITVEFAGPAPTEMQVWDAIAEFPGVIAQDERDRNRFPTPQRATCRSEVLIGRVRKDVSHPSAICMFACGDQLLKGAALNGVQIAERLIAEGRIS